MERDTTNQSLKVCISALCFALVVVACSSDASNASLADTTVDIGLPREAEGETANLISAFFGLDNGLLPVANRICSGASGKDGMPVIFSSEIDHTTMQAGDFKVTSADGKIGKMHCVSLLPATDAGELRTALLVGDFGDAKGDPPVRVEIIGNLHSIDQKRNFRGASLVVTPLADGPKIVLAERVSDKSVDLGLGMQRTKGSDCPAQGVAQAIRVVWAGGVTLANGEEPGDAERKLYRVSVRGPNNTERVIAPIALANLGDGDNNHVLCLDTADEALAVSFPAGILTDPNKDLNPQTSVVISD